MGRLRRAVHFVPGANEKLLRKSLTLPADSLVLDLEDAVAPEHKDAARTTVTDWLRQIDFGRQERVVRINPLDTPWGTRDLEVTIEGWPDAYLVPKAESPEDLRQIDALLRRLETERGNPGGEIKLMVLAAETPQGLFSIRELATSPRVDALTWGAEDLATAIGARRNRDEQGRFLDVFRCARVMTLLAAANARIQPVDTVYVDIRDHEGFRRECQEAAWMGFTGKLTIHPDQIQVVNEVFSPSQEEIAESQELLAAFEESRKSGAAVFRFRGRMVDVPHLTRARAILERARQADLV